MKREEKNLQSRRKILDAALNEFGTKPYELASLNTICSEGEVSKGIIYHYFKDKDELYLLCVQECYDALTAFLKGRRAPSGEAFSALKSWFFGAGSFFDHHPLYANLFAGAVLVPPRHLAASLRVIQHEYDAVSAQQLAGILSRAHLRPGITLAQALGTLCASRDLVVARIQRERLDEAALRPFAQQSALMAGLLLRGLLEPETK